MTNSQLLREKINDSGYKIAFVASKLGLSFQGFLNKINNKTHFKASEIQMLSELLVISKDEKELIFFA